MSESMFDEGSYKAKILISLNTKVDPEKDEHTQEGLDWNNVYA